MGDNGLADLPDQVVWGGLGTRMDADPRAMLVKWSPPLLRRMAQLQDNSASVEAARTNKTSPGV